jgi:hypothetical protein
LASSASEPANMIAAPTPWTARIELSTAMWPAAAQPSAETVKTERPTRNNRRRPSRSASAPAMSIVEASASV